jgi:hypothetical protein
MPVTKKQPLNDKPKITLTTAPHRKQTVAEVVFECNQPAINNSQATTGIYTHVSKLNFDKFNNPPDYLFFDSD